MIDWTSIILGVLALLSAVVTGFLIPWLRSKTTTEQQEQIRTTLRMLMGAAEVYFASGEGAKKKEWVLNQLKENYGIDGEWIEDWLEGMYRELLADNVIDG